MVEQQRKMDEQTLRVIIVFAFVISVHQTAAGHKADKNPTNALAFLTDIVILLGHSPQGTSQKLAFQPNRIAKH